MGNFPAYYLNVSKSVLCGCLSFKIGIALVSRWVPQSGCLKFGTAGLFFGVSSQWDNVSVTGRARGGRTHRDTEEGEAEEQAAKVFAFLARESSDFCRA